MDEMTLNVSTAAVRADGLSRRYGATVALDRVDVTMGRGITGLLGPNGAGKTTLLSILATVSEPDEGRVSVFGLDPRNAAGLLGQVEGRTSDDAARWLAGATPAWRDAVRVVAIDMRAIF